MIERRLRPMRSFTRLRISPQPREGISPGRSAWRPRPDCQWKSDWMARDMPRYPRDPGHFNGSGGSPARGLGLLVISGFAAGVVVELAVTGAPCAGFGLLAACAGFDWPPCGCAGFDWLVC